MSEKSKSKPLSVTATEFKNRAGQYLDESGEGPVFITRHGRKARVLLNINDYERLFGLVDDETGLRDEVIETLRAHESELSDMGIEHLALFGSVARGEATSESDVDLIVTFRPKVRVGLKMVSIKERLEEILGRTVDLLRTPIEKSRLKNNIEPDLIHAF